MIVGAPLEPALHKAATINANPDWMELNLNVLGLVFKAALPLLQYMKK